MKLDRRRTDEERAPRLEELAARGPLRFLAFQVRLIAYGWGLCRLRRHPLGPLGLPGDVWVMTDGTHHRACYCGRRIDREALR